MNLLLLVCSAILLVAPSQALSCVEAEAEFTDPSATACNDILTSGDIFHMSDENIQKFCTDHNCPAVLTRVYGDIAKACGNGIDPTSSYFGLLSDACWQFNKTDCLTLWKIYIYPVEAGIQGNFSLTYSLCVQDYQQSRTNCSSYCKTILTEISNDLGCCYDAIASIGPPFLGQDILRTCGISIPETCASKKKKK